MRLFRLEIERSLRRRAVWSLLLVAIAGIVVIGLVAFLSSAGMTAAEVRRQSGGHPAVVRNWWAPGTGGDGVLLVTGVFLLMGGLIGGAVVVGGEWRTGSIATTLTWEPRRVRLLVTRLAAMAVCAFGLSFLLQALALAALLPAVVANGTTAGADGDFAVSVVAAMARFATLTALAAVLAGSVAWISRSTAGAIVALWAWVALGEMILRARKPWSGRYLLAENVATVVEWARPDGVAHGRGPASALSLLALYVVLAAGAASWVFRRTDVLVA